MAIIKLKAGETVLVSAVDSSLKPDQGLPGGPDLGLGVPSHPIILPGDPTHPIAPLPGEPTHPIQPVPPGGSPPKPSHPIVDLPSHPIVLPPPGQIPPPIDGGTTPGWKLQTAWTPVTGWVVVAIPTGPTPTPSRK